jgi:hypothetical protein
MIPLLGLLLAILASPFKSKRQLEAENVALRLVNGAAAGDAPGASNSTSASVFRPS